MVFRSIGIIRTPYLKDSCVPYQPIDTGADDKHEFFVDIDDEHVRGLYLLETFRYIYLLYHIDRLSCSVESTVQPPWAGGIQVGVFASRAPARPNPIGLSIVRLLSVQGNRFYTSALDVFDETPLLDIKPYIKDLDSKPDANFGWVEQLPNCDHLLLHIKGVPHDY